MQPLKIMTDQRAQLQTPKGEHDFHPSSAMRARFSYRRTSSVPSVAFPSPSHTRQNKGKRTWSNAFWRSSSGTVYLDTFRCSHHSFCRFGRRPTPNPPSSPASPAFSEGLATPLGAGLQLSCRPKGVPTLIVAKRFGQIFISFSEASAFVVETLSIPLNFRHLVLPGPLAGRNGSEDGLETRRLSLSEFRLARGDGGGQEMEASLQFLLLLRVQLLEHGLLRAIIGGIAVRVVPFILVAEILTVLGTEGISNFLIKIVVALWGAAFGWPRRRGEARC
ncbi:hypothetical protein BDD12DRAFT_536654 [Trichophaea hybrida]|nr:hypothetical protein BDD12DRAFT_536654 [Trichophaea hybrida]